MNCKVILFKYDVLGYVTRFSAADIALGTTSEPHHGYKEVATVDLGKVSSEDIKTAIRKYTEHHPLLTFIIDSEVVSVMLWPTLFYIWKGHYTAKYNVVPNPTKKIMVNFKYAAFNQFAEHWNRVIDKLDHINKTLLSKTGREQLSYLAERFPDLDYGSCCCVDFDSIDRQIKRELMARETRKLLKTLKSKE